MGNVRVRTQRKSLGDTHHRHAHDQPEAKQRQEPADPFLRISGPEFDTLRFAAAITRISAVSANLIAVIEPVFNPIWVFLALGEKPGSNAVIGGLIIVVAVTGASVFGAMGTTS
jgi:hypothetical protein